MKTDKIKISTEYLWSLFTLNCEIFEVVICQDDNRELGFVKHIKINQYPKPLDENED